MINKKHPKHNLRQIKLTNGDEIVADIVEWNNEEHDEIAIKNAMKLSMYENQTGDKYFSFRPFMIYQEGEEDIQVVLNIHVVAIAVPMEALLVQYRIAVQDMHKTHLERLQGVSDEMDIADIQRMTREAIEKMKVSTEDMQMYLDELDSFDSFDGDSDSGHNNVIDLFGKKTIH